MILRIIILIRRLIISFIIRIFIVLLILLPLLIITILIIIIILPLRLLLLIIIISLLLLRFLCMVLRVLCPIACTAFGLFSSFSMSCFFRPLDYVAACALRGGTPLCSVCGLLPALFSVLGASSARGYVLCGMLFSTGEYVCAVCRATPPG